MSSLIATRLRKHSLIFCILAVLACVLAGTWANAQSDDLLTAAGKGDLARVKTLIDAGSDVNAKRTNGATALIAASLQGHLDVVRALLDAKADVNAKASDDGSTALMVASQNGHADAVRALLDAKADVNAKAGSGRTALIQASQNGHADVVRVLLDAKADVNAKAGNGATALMLASLNGHLEVVRALLAARADVNAKAGNGATALIMASYNGRQEVVRELLDAKVEVNAKTNDGYTALMKASQNGHQDVVRALLEAKADVNAKMANGVTALMLASQNGHQDVVRALLEAKADVNAKAGDGGSTALMLASLNGHQDVVRALLEAKADVNAKMAKGVTALMLASQNGHQEVVQALLDAKADVNAKADNGATALILASEKGHGDVARALLAAASAGRVDMVDLLLAKGVDINTKNNNGETAPAPAPASATPQAAAPHPSTEAAKAQDATITASAACPQTSTAAAADDQGGDKPTSSEVGSVDQLVGNWTIQQKEVNSPPGWYAGGADGLYTPNSYIPMWALASIESLADNFTRITVNGIYLNGRVIDAHYQWTGKLDGKQYPVTGDPDADSWSMKRGSGDNYNTYFLITRKCSQKVVHGGGFMLDCNHDSCRLMTNELVVVKNGKAFAKSKDGRQVFQGMQPKVIATYRKTALLPQRHFSTPISQIPMGELPGEEAADQQLISDLLNRVRAAYAASTQDRQMDPQVALALHLLNQFGYQAGAKVFPGDLDILMRVTRFVSNGKWLNDDFQITNLSDAIKDFHSSFSENEIRVLKAELSTAKTADAAERQALLKDARLKWQ